MPRAGYSLFVRMNVSILIFFVCRIPQTFLLCDGFHETNLLYGAKEQSTQLGKGRAVLCCGYKSNRWAEAGQERGNIHRQQSARSPLLAMAPLTPLFLGRFQQFIITV